MDTGTTQSITLGPAPQQGPEETGPFPQWVGGSYLAEFGSQEGPGVQVSCEAAVVGGQEGGRAGARPAW